MQELAFVHLAGSAGATDATDATDASIPPDDEVPSPDGGELRCAATWHAASASPEVAALAEASSRNVLAAGQSLPGRVWAFRRPAWVADVGASEPRAATARRAGLMTAAAFPIAIADHCAGVIEFFSQGISEPNPEVSAMFATVGGQLAQYLERHPAPRRRHAPLARRRRGAAARARRRRPRAARQPATRARSPAAPRRSCWAPTGSTRRCRRPSATPCAPRWPAASAPSTWWTATGS